MVNKHMNIGWINCAEHMPSLDDPEAKVIARGKNTNVIREVTCYFMRHRIPHYDRADIYWTEFTQEKWDYLNAAG